MIFGSIKKISKSLDSIFPTSLTGSMSLYGENDVCTIFDAMSTYFQAV